MPLSDHLVLHVYPSVLLQQKYVSHTNASDPPRQTCKELRGISKLSSFFFFPVRDFASKLGRI